MPSRVSGAATKMHSNGTAFTTPPGEAEATEVEEMPYTATEPGAITYEQRHELQSPRERYASGTPRRSRPAHRSLFECNRLAGLPCKVVRIGSVGDDAVMFLLAGPGHDDPLSLQLKQAGNSVLGPHVQAPDVTHPGPCVVDGQRLMQAVSDIFLGWSRNEPHGGRTRCQPGASGRPDIDLLCM